jgi:hypothetical protein
MDVIRVPTDAFFRQLPGARLTGISELLLTQGKQERSAERTAFLTVRSPARRRHKVHDRAPDISSGDTGATATEQDAHLIEAV